ITANRIERLNSFNSSILNNFEEIFEKDKIVKIVNSNETYLNFSKLFEDFFIFPKPIEVKRILIPDKFENESAKLVEVGKGSYIVFGVKFPNTIPFIVLETNDGTKIISKDDIFIINKKRHHEDDKGKSKRSRRSKGKRKSKSKKSTKRQKSKSKNIRKS
ncbi:MAG: hypothetical protein QXI16_06015, partial [Sulfolobaceae archaeon]